MRIPRSLPRLMLLLSAHDKRKLLSNFEVFFEDSNNLFGRQFGAFTLRAADDGWRSAPTFFELRQFVLCGNQISPSSIVLGYGVFFLRIARALLERWIKRNDDGELGCTRAMCQPDGSFLHKATFPSATSSILIPPPSSAEIISFLSASTLSR